MSAPRDYARLHHSWYLDPVLVACAAQVPTAIHVWPVLLAMAKANSHVDGNPTGVISTSPAQLSMIVHAAPERVQAALDVLVEGELMTVEHEGRLGTVRVTLAGFTKWQTPRGSSADTSQTYRDKQKRASRGKAPQRDIAVTDASGKSDGEGEGEERESKAAASSSTARGAATAAADSVPPKTRSIAGQIQSARHELQSHASAVIEAMIGRRQGQTDRMLTDAVLLDEYWKPALRLRHEHGAPRLREALNKAGAANAMHLRYIEPILAEAKAEADRPQPRRRLLTEVIADHDAFWETAS